MKKETTDFLRFYRRGLPEKAIIALTFLSNSHPPKTEFLTPEKLLKLTDFPTDQYDIYIRTTVLKTMPEKGRGKKEDTLGSSFIWVDFDYYKVPGLTEQTALDTLEALKPSCIVNSGHGLQGWWKLDRFTEDLDLIESNSKSVALSLKLSGGDPCWDVTRLLRVPGTLNHKTDPAVPVKIVTLRAVKYSVEDFKPAVAKSVQKAEPLPPGFETKLPEIVWNRISTEQSAKTAGAALKDDQSVDASRNDMWIATKLLSLGYSAGTVLAVLSHPSWFSGAHFRRKKNQSYLTNTIQAALQQQSFFDISKSGKITFAPVRLAEYILEKYNILTVGGWFHIYKEGVFRGDEEHFIEKYIQELLQLTWKPIHQQAVVQWIRDQTATDPRTQVRYSDLLNVKNGMLNVYDRTLIPHDPVYHSFTQLPVTFAETVESSKVLDFIGAIIPADAVNTFWEFMGSVLLSDYRFKKALLLVGPGNTGKSALLSLIRRVFGKENASSTSIQDLTADRFAKAELFGKLINIYADLSLSTIDFTGQFKSLTGDDEILVQRKFGQPFSFVNQAKLIFSANDFSAVSKPDPTFFDRFIVIPCNHKFVLGKDAVPNIVSTFSQQDLSAFLNYSLDGLTRLIKNSQFTVGESSRVSQQEFLEVSDNVVGFIYSATAIDDEAQVLKIDFYTAYKGWCFRTHHTPFSSIRFFRRVKQSFEQFKLAERYAVVGDQQKWCYTGRQLLDKVEITAGVIKFHQGV